MNNDIRRRMSVVGSDPTTRRSIVRRDLFDKWATEESPTMSWRNQSRHQEVSFATDPGTHEPQFYNKVGRPPSSDSNFTAYMRTAVLNLCLRLH